MAPYDAVWASESPQRVLHSHSTPRLPVGAYIRPVRMDRVKVVYIAGSGRSGSTLLDGVLGQGPGFFPAGELRSIWTWGAKPSARCGCGEPFRDCAFWADVFREAFGSLDCLNHPERFPHGFPELHRRDIARLVLPLRSASFERAVAAHAANLQALYASIARVSGCRGIIDSSKRFEYAYLLSAVAGIDLYVVHLVRDSRAVTSSELKWEARKYGGTYREPTKLLARRALAWSGNQLFSELLRARDVKYLLMRYEDFAIQPKAALDRVGRFIGEDVSDLPFVGEASMEFSANHAAIGNPVRFHQGRIDIRLDEAWRERMKPADKHLVTALTWPLLRRYGYVGAAS